MSQTYVSTSIAVSDGTRMRHLVLPDPGALAVLLQGDGSGSDVTIQARLPELDRLAGLIAEARESLAALAVT